MRNVTIPRKNTYTDANKGEFKKKCKKVAHLSYLRNELVEEHYKQETRDLLSTIKKLQDENRKLASSLAAATERDSAFSEDGE